MTKLARILLYPIKSFDGVSVTSATVMASGALEWDRRFAMADAEGSLINGKREPRVHRLRARFDLSQQSVELRTPSTNWTGFRFEERREIEHWLSLALGQPVQLLEEPTTGMPDDLDAPGPTIVSRGSLQAAARWCDLEEDDARRRLRANLELDAVEPFWEDRLFGCTDEPVRFQIGEASFVGVGPCARCVVPSRDPDNGQVSPHFAKLLSRQREAELPSWAESSRFDHFYRFAVNTRVPPNSVEQRLQIGEGLIIATPN